MVHEIDVCVDHYGMRVYRVRVKLDEFVRSAAPFLVHVIAQVFPPYLRCGHRSVPEQDLVPQIGKYVRAVRCQFGVHYRVHLVIVFGTAPGRAHRRPVYGMAKDRGGVEQARRRGLLVGTLYQGNGVRDHDRSFSCISSSYYSSSSDSLILLDDGIILPRNRRCDDDTMMQRQPEQQQRKDQE